MSGANRGQVSELHNQENMLSRLRGSLKARAAAAASANENQENHPPKQQAAAGRTVLGALQNNQRSKTQTQQRGSKQVRLGNND